MRVPGVLQGRRHSGRRRSSEDTNPAGKRTCLTASPCGGIFRGRERVNVRIGLRARESIKQTDHRAVLLSRKRRDSMLRLRLTFVFLPFSFAAGVVQAADRTPAARAIDPTTNAQQAQEYCACQVQARYQNSWRLYSNLAASQPATQPTTPQVCVNLCAAAAAPYLGPSGATARIFLANSACYGFNPYPNNWVFGVYYVAPSPNNPWSSAQPGFEAVIIGTLVNIPASTVTVYTCPSAWSSNTSNQLGGVTTDGLCKRGPVGTLTSPTPPANGTPIGSIPQGWPNAWGFVWSGAIFEYGTPANGGAAVKTTPTTPAVCKIV